MRPAEYCCTEEGQSPELWFHYGLNVPIYTHFTSPIRRYPDVLVHRLLAAALSGHDGGAGDIAGSGTLHEVCVGTGRFEAFLFFFFFVFVFSLLLSLLSAPFLFGLFV